MYTQLEAQPPREQKGTQKTNSWTRARPASAQRPVPLGPRRVRHGKSRSWLSLGRAPAWGDPLCKREASVATDSCCVHSHSSTPKGPETRSTVAAASTTEAQVVSKQPPAREARAPWRWQLPGQSGKQTRTRRGEDYPTQTKKMVLFTVIRKKTQYLRPHRIKSATDSTTNTVKASLSPSREGARPASWPGEGLHPRPAPLHPSGTHLSWGPPLGPALLEGPELKGLLLYRTRRTRERHEVLATEGQSLQGWSRGVHPERPRRLAIVPVSKCLGWAQVGMPKKAQASKQGRGDSRREGKITGTGRSE